MAATVRVFYFSGIVTAPVVAGTKYATDSVGMLKYPYLAASSVSATGTAASSDAAPAAAKIALVQVQAGKAVHFEINDPNRSTAATTSSPVLTGSDTFVVGPGWSISFVENTE